MTGPASTESGADEPSDDGTAWAERILIGVSTAMTILLIAFVIWQGMTVPETAEPTTRVSDTATLPNGDVKVTVTLRNSQDVGLVMATVEVDCDAPPPELTFEHVPANDRQTGYVICPPATAEPTAVVSSWTEA